MDTPILNVLSVWHAVLKDMEQLRCKNSLTVGITEDLQIYQQYGVGAKTINCEDHIILGMEMEPADQWREEISSKAAIRWLSTTIAANSSSRDTSETYYIIAVLPKELKYFPCK